MTSLKPPDVAEVLAAGLRWIYDTVQPDGAVIQHHGYSYRTGDVMYRFAGRGSNGLPVVVVNRVERSYSRTGALLNPLTAAELVPVPLLLDQLGHPADRFWNSADPTEPRGSTGSFGLAQPAHPSLLAAVVEYLQGCPDHRTVFCGREGTHPACRWWRDGNAKAVPPSWPARAAA